MDRKIIAFRLLLLCAQILGGCANLEQAPMAGMEAVPCAPLLQPATYEYAERASVVEEPAESASGQSFSDMLGLVIRRAAKPRERRAAEIARPQIVVVRAAPVVIQPAPHVHRYEHKTRVHHTERRASSPPTVSHKPVSSGKKSSGGGSPTGGKKKK